MKPKFLTNPPLTEVVFDLRTNISPEIKLDELEKLHDQISQEYPEKNPIYIGQIDLKSDKQESVLIKSGFRFDSEEKDRIVQYRLDGFTFNQLSPYPGWNKAIVDAKKLWEVYKSAFKPGVCRIAVRSINTISFPCFPYEISEYLAIFPKFPNDFPSMENAVVQAQFPYPGGMKVLATQKIGHTPPSSTSILFDIDVFINFDSDVIDEDQIWKSFDKIREIKNKIFFGSISQKGEQEII